MGGKNVVLRICYLFLITIAAVSRFPVGPVGSMNLLLYTYDYVYYLCNGNEAIIHVVAGTVFACLDYILFNSIFVILDLWSPKWAQHYKIQEEKPINWSKYVSALGPIVFNMIPVAMVTATLFYQLGKYTGLNYHPSQVPSFTTAALQFLFFILVEEIFFYYSHRLLHHPRLYKHVHKMHHEWTAPVSIVSIYCHPIEHFLSNLTPVLLGPTLLGSHVLVSWVWIAMAIFSTTSSHSGYHFPLQWSAETHDWHHKVFNECFGVLGWLDSFHGTNKNFMKSVHSKRNTLIALGDVKKMYPEDKKEE